MEEQPAKNDSFIGWLKKEVTSGNLAPLFLPDSQNPEEPNQEAQAGKSFYEGDYAMSREMFDAVEALGNKILGYAKEKTSIWNNFMILKWLPVTTTSLENSRAQSLAP